MTMLITLKHPVLGYCLCLDSYFAGDCVCENETSPTISGIDTKQSCCSSCGESSSQGEFEAPIVSSPTTVDPCDGCTEHWNVDVGEFVWNHSDDTPAAPEFLEPPVAIFADEAIFDTLKQVASVAPIRGDPPPRLRNTTIPLYLRHAEMRL